MRTHLVIALATFAAFIAPTRPSYRPLALTSEGHPAGTFVASGKIKTAGKMPARLNPIHAAAQSASAPPFSAQSQSAQSATTAENPCGPTGEIRAFDYMLGDWTTTDAPPPPGGTASGTSHTETILDGCAILEHRHIEQNGKTLFNADVIWGYDVVKKQMLLFYVDDHAHTQLYEGRRENGGWSFYRDRPDKDGTMFTIRINYAQDGSRFTQTVHRSKDHGATWEPGQSVATYDRKR